MKKELTLLQMMKEVWKTQRFMRALRFNVYPNFSWRFNICVVWLQLYAINNNKLETFCCHKFQSQTNFILINVKTSLSINQLSWNDQSGIKTNDRYTWRHGFAVGKRFLKMEVGRIVNVNYCGLNTPSANITMILAEILPPSVRALALRDWVEIKHVYSLYSALSQ